MVLNISLAGALFWSLLATSIILGLSMPPQGRARLARLAAGLTHRFARRRLSGQRVAGIPAGVPVDGKKWPKIAGRRRHAAANQPDGNPLDAAFLYLVTLYLVTLSKTRGDA